MRTEEPPHRCVLYQIITDSAARSRYGRYANILVDPTASVVNSVHGNNKTSSYKRVPCSTLFPSYGEFLPKQTVSVRASTREVQNDLVASKRNTRLQTFYHRAALLCAFFQPSLVRYRALFIKRQVIYRQGKHSDIGRSTISFCR